MSKHSQFKYDNLSFLKIIYKCREQIKICLSFCLKQVLIKYTSTVKSKLTDARFLAIGIARFVTTTFLAGVMALSTESPFFLFLADLLTAGGFSACFGFLAAAVFLVVAFLFGILIVSSFFVTYLKYLL